MGCAAPIPRRDNIPLVSYVLLRGRCRRCGTRIPLRDPAIELVSALLIAGSVFAFGLTVTAVAAATFCAALVVVSATDLELRIVPNRVVLPAAAAVLALRTIADPSPEWALGAVAAAGALFIVAMAYPGGMGMGDVKLALLLGAMLGRSVWIALMLALLLAVVPSVAMLARYGQRARKLAIPFAPFLAAGGLIALFAGPRLLDLYLRGLT
jgi:leader peptidase (prepilin peptidase)/N-methyltransferase